MRKRYTLPAILAMLLAPIVSFAHPGHGNLSDSVLHYFSSPQHIAQGVMLIILISALAVLRHAQKKNS